jgi:hypothetical protein
MPKKECGSGKKAKAPPAKEKKREFGRGKVRVWSKMYVHYKYHISFMVSYKVVVETKWEHWRRDYRLSCPS